MKPKVWTPLNWTRPSRTAKQLKIGDCVRNPCYDPKVGHTDEAYERAVLVDSLLAERGLKIDHPHCVIGFVIPEDDEKV